MISVEGKKVVIYDIRGTHVKNNEVFLNQTSYANKYLIYLYKECLKRGIQIVTPDIYFALPKKPKAICVRFRSDLDMTTTMALKRSGVRLAYLTTSEHPLYGCRFYWNLKRLSEYFDYTEIMTGAKTFVSPKSRFVPWYLPHPYLSHVREVKSDFRQKKSLVMIQSNMRIHPLRRFYVRAMNFLKPLPTLELREGYKARLDAVKYFSQYPDFDLYGFGWDRSVRNTYTHKYDEAIRKSYRGVATDKFETMKQYKFSICFDPAHFGGFVIYLMDSIYTGAVPIYWGAPDVADIVPDNCYIDFRKFGYDFRRVDEYIRGMSEEEYNGYIKNINAFIASPRAYNLSQEKYASDMIKIFESYF